jgi:O-antigen/teichoic acid export membrane protein
MTALPRTLTRGSLLAKNIVLNLGGSALPALAALVAVPVLVRALGDVRFSVLLLAWTSLGYFSLFDLGIGRAVTHAVADRMGSDREHEIGPAIWTSLFLLLPVGIVGGAILYVLAPALTTLLKVPGSLAGEAMTSFRILAYAVPFIAIAGALRGALEAKQLFGVVNALRIPHGLLTFVGPMLALPFSHSLVPAIALLATGRALLGIAHFVVAWKVLADFAHPRKRWDRALARSLASFGGWTQITSIVSPVLATLDRFVVGAVLGIATVTYYATPHELVTKMWLFTIASMPVFFSAFAHTAARHPERTARLFDRLIRLTISVMFLPAFILVALAPDILRIWLGATFATQSTAVMQVLAIGVFVNCVGQGAFTLIQALGRPDITGKYHVAELPIYAALLWFFLPRYGILGAAVVWSIRTIGDTVLLLATCPRLLPQSRASVVRIALWLVVTSVALGVSVMLPTMAVRLLIVAAAIPLWGLVVWYRLLTNHERTIPLARRFIEGWRPEQA